MSTTTSDLHGGSPPAQEEEPNGSGRVSAVIQPPTGYVAVETYIVYAEKSLIETPPTAEIAGVDRPFEVPDFAGSLKKLAEKAYADQVVVSTTESLTRKTPRQHIATIVWVETPGTASARAKHSRSNGSKPTVAQVPKLMTELARLQLNDEVVAAATERGVKVKVVARELLCAKHGITNEELSELVREFNED